MNLELQITGTREILEGLVKNPQLLARGLQLAALHAQSVVQERKLSGQVLHVRTGRLRGSIAAGQVEGMYPVYFVRVGTSVIYARIHELGGVILPRRGKFLVFEVGGKTVFAKSVTIPRRPYLEPGVHEAAPGMAQVIGQTIEGGLLGGTGGVSGALPLR